MPQMGYLKEIPFTGHIEYVDDYRQATSFGRDTALKLKLTKYVGTKLVKVTSAGLRKLPRALPGGRNATKVTPVAAHKRITHVGICLDASGSMSPIATEVVKAVNGVLKALRDDRGAGLETDVSFWTFGINTGRPHVSNSFMRNPNGVNGTLSHEVREDYFRVPSSQVKDVSGYYTSGMTPLADSIGNCIERLMSIPVEPGTDVSYLIQVLTDGHENSSTRFTTSLCRDAVLARQATDRWTFAFLVPPGGKDHFVKTFGLPEGNVKEWEGTTRGVREMAVGASVSTSAYLGLRTAGVSHTTDYFTNVTADLSNVNESDLGRKLTDVTNRVKSIKVERESGIKEFLESKEGVYRKGDAFFPITKTERVAIDKKILVRDKKTGHVYTGKNVRQVLNLPDKNAKITPGNMAWLDVYSQSTSDNRKLVRGTDLLYVKPGHTLDV